MTKHELLLALTNTWQNFLLGMLLPELITDEAWTRLAGKRIIFSGSEGPRIYLSTQWYSDIIMNADARMNALGEFEKALKRSVVGEGHELILYYCEQTHQFEKYKAVSWFQFARLLRNAISHNNAVLGKWPSDLKKKGITSVTWGTRTLDISMVGKEISFTHLEAMQLIADQKNFVEAELV